MSELEQSNVETPSTYEEIISNESPESEVETNEASPVSDNQETEPQEKTDEKPFSVEEALKAVKDDEEKPEANVEILNQINALGLVHNGAPVKIENVDQVKELIQKGYDYTKKTMALKEEAKVFEETKTKTQAEFQEKQTQLQQYEESLAELKQENQIMGLVLQKFQNSDADLFGLIAQEYQSELNRHLQNINNPEIKKVHGELGTLKNELNSLKAEKQEAAKANIRQDWETGVKKLQSEVAPKLAKLGVAVSWDKVQKVWASDASNSLTPAEALNAAYGSEIQKAYESYNKKLETKNKTSNTMLKRTGIGSNPGGKEETKNYGGNYEALLRSVSV